jgi:cell division septal protein FtsQ
MQQRFRPKRDANRRNRYDVTSAYGKTMREGPRWEVPHVNRAISVAVLLCILVAVLVIWFTGDDFHIHDVNVQNNQGVPAAQIIAASGLKGEHWFFVDLNAAAGRVGELPGVQSAHVTCVAQAGCTILIQPAPALAIWQSATDNSTQVWVDQNGKVQRALNNVPAKLTVVQDDGDLPVLGTPLDDNVLRALKELVSLQPSVTRYNFSAQYGLEYTDARGWQVRLGVADSDGEMRRKLEVLKQISDQLVAKHQTPRVLDVRYVNAPFYVQ